MLHGENLRKTAEVQTIAAEQALVSKEHSKNLDRCIDAIENSLMPRVNLVEPKINETTAALVKQLELMEDGIEETKTALAKQLKTDLAKQLKTDLAKQLKGTENDITSAVLDSISQTTNSIATNLSKHIDQKTNKDLLAISSNLDQLYLRVESFQRLHNGDFDQKFKFGSLSGWAIHSDSLQLVIEYIKGKDTILELGAGVSTYYLAQTIKDQGHGKLISIEHDLVFYEKIKTKLKELELSEYCHLLYCPLIDHEIEGEIYPWYDNSLTDFLESTDIDVMLVDGPPGYLREQSRYPALPVLEQHLSANCLILLDDAKRIDEQNIANKWIDDHGLTSTMHSNSKGLMALEFPQ